MCYYPYFRGKQYELITIRETVDVLTKNKFVPIIEPVKEQLGQLEKTLDAVCEEDGHAILIINPQFGDHSSSGQTICEFLTAKNKKWDNIFAGILLTEELSIEDITILLDTCKGKLLALIHSGFSQAGELSSILKNRQDVAINIFLEDYCGRLYRRHFNDSPERILVRDGFQRRRNRDHPEVEFFSDLHATYEEEKMTGFGDFSIVGDDYSESGGPAYAVAIHLTFIAHDKDDEMHIHHFVSDRRDTPQDPAGKFAEALEKLMDELQSPENQIETTSAIHQFKDLYERGHFPGLGYVKKLSMKHHIETLASYLSS